MWYSRVNEHKLYRKLTEGEKVIFGSGAACIMQSVLDTFEEFDVPENLDCFVLDEMSAKDRVVYGCETLLMVFEDEFSVPICAQHDAFLRNFLSHTFLHVREEKSTREKLFSHAQFLFSDADEQNLDWWADAFNAMLDKFVPSLAFEVLSHLPRGHEEGEELGNLFAKEMGVHENYYSWYSEEEINAKIDDLVMKTAHLMKKFRKLKV
jgi:hypothetical protein